MAATSITGIKGFNDILPGEVEKWQWVESVARRIFSGFGFQEIRVPILEKTELLPRYRRPPTSWRRRCIPFEDRNGQLVTLRPEATASVVRAFIEHGLHVRPTMRKLYTIGPCFAMSGPRRAAIASFTR